MVNSQELRAAIVRNNLRHADVAKKLGISEASFSRKINQGSWGLDEASKLIDILGIQNPTEIFFAKNLT